MSRTARPKAIPAKRWCGVCPLFGRRAWALPIPVPDPALRFYQCRYGHIKAVIVDPTWMADKSPVSQTS